MNNISIDSLFDLTTCPFASVFDGLKYPWDAIQRINNIFDIVDLTGYNEIKDNVWASADVDIHPLAVVEGPCIIGCGTHIRPFAYIRGNAVIGENCVIGNSSELKNSILLNNVQIPHYNYVGDSILGNYSHLGAGVICSNLKSNKSEVTVHGISDIATGMRKLGAIIGDGAEIGCGTILNPGTVIGRNSIVYPNISVRGTVPPDSILKNATLIVKKRQG